MEYLMRMPDVGTVDPTVLILKWLVEIGQVVRRGDPLLEVETDKSIITLESVASGVLEATLAPAGSEAAAGEVIARFQVDDKSPLAAMPVPARPKPEGALTGPASHPEHTAAQPAARSSFFARNRAAQASQAEARPEPEFPLEFLMGLYERMTLIREFEEGVKFLFLEGSMPGTIHQCQGQEATAVGVCAALSADDVITSTFRGHGHALAKGLSVEALLYELYGASTGCCRGKGGSMHVGDMAKGMVPGIAIVGGGIPLAAGMALAIKMRKGRQVVVCFFGDGAVAEGAFHEGVNLAAIWDLPVVFVCENNLYGASTRVDRVMRNSTIADRALAYGFRGETVDGNDVLAVYAAARQAVRECREGLGPVLLELLTYRRTGHSRRDACNYQPADEREAWMARDPIEVLAARLLAAGRVTAAELGAVTARHQARFQAAVASAGRQPLPTAADLTTDVLA